MTKNPFCRPRLRPANAVTTKSRRFSPMSLLDRLREAVFRLIMLSALSRGSNDLRRRSPPPSSSDHYYYPGDAHHSEAVADCLEFIKKSATATATDESRDSTAPSGSADSAEPPPVVAPLPVM